MRRASGIRRRSFLRRASSGALGLAAIGSAGVGSAWAANETVRLGAIGTGGRSRGALIPAAKKVADTALVAVCDVWDDALDAARALAQPGAFATKDHHALLERRDVDAVIVATPDHWHVPITVDACAAGKDVYVEKPLTHEPAEGEAVIAAQDRYRRVVQVGTQQRSMPQFLAAKEMVQRGEIGKVLKVHLCWNRGANLGRPRYDIPESKVDWKRFVGNAPAQPFDEFRFRNWRWIWDFGGGLLTDLMVHYIDIAHWFLGLDHPETATTVGSWVQAEGLWETPETIQTLLVYPEHGLQAHFEGTFSNAHRGAMIEFMGRDGTLYVDRGRWVLQPERGKGERREFSPGTSPEGADFDRSVDGGYLHMQNFVDCVRSRAKPRAPAEDGVSSATGAHLGNAAFRRSKVMHWRELWA